MMHLKINIYKVSPFNVICFFCREIQAATGEWIHDYLNRGLNFQPDICDWQLPQKARPFYVHDQ